MAPPKPKPFSFGTADQARPPPGPGDAPEAAGHETRSAPPNASSLAAEILAAAGQAQPAPQPRPAAEESAALRDDLLFEPEPRPAEPTAPLPPVATEPPPMPVASAWESPIAPAVTRITLPPPAPEQPVRTGGIYVVALLASLIWAGALAAFVFGNAGHAGALTMSPITLAFVALLAVAPMGLIWAGAYVVVQARTLAVQAQRSKRLTDELIGPTALAAAQAGNVVEAMRGQVAMAVEVANQAREHLTALREALAVETENLAHATAHASRTAVTLVETLSRERTELNTLALTLDARAAAVTDAINRQVDMVMQASELAETNLREAEAALAARAADLAAAAGEAVDASRVATEDLGRQVVRLETASGGVGDQMRMLEEGLTHQRAALVTVAHQLRAEQEDFATLTESRTAQLAEFVSGAQADVTKLSDASHQGAKALSELIGEASSKFGELADAAGAERDAFARSAEGTLKDLSEAGARERQHLEAAMRSTIEALSTAAVEAREAADVHAEAARARVDLLNEAAFTAGQKADQVFESRLGQARGLIEQSARLVEDAGSEASSRLEAQVAAARVSLQGLNEMMDEVSARAARLPAETGAKAAEIKAAVQEGLDELLSSARRAAEETQAIDAAFQERVKRNYEMLSEAVQLMGVVAQGGSGAAGLQRSSPAERARGRVAAALPTRELPAPMRDLPPPTTPRPADTAASSPLAAPEPPAAAGPAPQEPFPAGGMAGLRGRLRLTPTATDDEFKAAFETASGQPAPPPSAAGEEAGWTWKELLTTLDGEPQAAQSPATPAAPGVSPGRPVSEPLRGGQIQGGDGRLGEDLFREIESMGIDPNALLPKGRIEEIAAAVQTGDGFGAREVVRTLAPAAIRRVARRLLSDVNFRGGAGQLIARYAELIADASRRDKQGFQAAALLATNAGRAYLLLDAAAGQPG